MAEPPPSPPLPAPATERPILHVIFAVDGSGSMTGERIASLNWAARAAIPAMREAAADHPEVDVRVRVLRFGDEVEWPVATPVPVGEFVWSALAAGGETAMGAALTAIAAALTAEGAADRTLLPPVIVLLSDGLPTDDARAGIAALDGCELGASAVRIPIAIGQDADLDLLAEFIGDPALRPLRAQNAEMLVNRIRWAASVPLDAAASAATPDPLAAIAGSAPRDDAAESSLVW